MVAARSARKRLAAARSPGPIDSVAFPEGNRVRTSKGRPPARPVARLGRAAYRAALAGYSAFLAACYTYVPTTLDAAPVGSHLRVLLTESAGQSLLAFGVQPGRALAGQLQGRDADRLLLLVPSVPIGSAAGGRPLYQQVRLNAADILRVDRRQVDPVRTSVVSAIAAAAVGVAAWQAFSGHGEATPPPTGGQPPESLRGFSVRARLGLP